METAQPLLEYLPESFRRTAEGDYIVFLWEALESNYRNGKCQFAMLACHMLYMSFVYFTVWQIKTSRPNDFAKSLVGFSKDDEKGLMEATSPFSFWTISEARVFRFLKLIGCGNEDIGKFAKLVQQRNDIAHCNGNIFYSDPAAADSKIEEVLDRMNAIHTCMTPVIHDCLRSFLIESWNEDKREYPDPVDQIREILIHTNYLSRKDIESCLEFDVTSLSAEAGYTEIKALFDILAAQYRTGDE